MAEDTEEVFDDNLENDDVVDDIEEEKKSTNKEDDEDVVPVRKNVINAQRRIIESQAKKLKKSSESDENTDEELTSQARKLINSEVEKRLQPLQQDIETRALLRDYLFENPEYKDLEGRARKYLEAHPTLTVEDTFKILTYGQEKEAKAKAEEKVIRNKMGGSTKRAEATKLATSQKDMEEVYKKVKRGETGDALRALGIEK